MESVQGRGGEREKGDRGEEQQKEEGGGREGEEKAGAVLVGGEDWR